MKRRIKLIRNLTLSIIFVISVFYIISLGNETKTMDVQNISNVRSIQAVHLISKYDPNEVITEFVTSFDQILELGPKTTIKFNGTMTGYGPDCVGCGGRVGCPPSQNVTNGNVFFNDNEYGTIRIVASDKRIPCGTIVKITNSTVGDEVVAIVLDRGGAIKGTLMDFLVPTEQEASRTIGRQNVTYEIVRWGW